MWKEQLRAILKNIKKGTINLDTAYQKLTNLISGQMGFAEIDRYRSLRTGFPEIIFCPKKEDKDIISIVKTLYKDNGLVLLTRARQSTFALLKKKYKQIEYYPRSGTITLGRVQTKTGLIAIVSAGTSDIPVAEEAQVTAQIMGANVQTFWDIGVAGIHRLMTKLDQLRQSRVIVAVAGMDGALPGVIAGLVSCPIIAVPTSVGYGASFKGISALLTMLNACAPGVAVVNIDNGFGAGYTAALINQIGE